MSMTIQISDDTFKRLQAIAIPFVDTPDDVIKRLLDQYNISPIFEEEMMSSNSFNIVRDEKTNLLAGRESRQRGIRIQINGNTFKAESLSDLYFQVLRYLYDQGFFDKIRSEIPLATSQKRYLIAKKPVHPNGNDFVVPVEYMGYYMEAHKDYKTGVKHLQALLKHCGLSLDIL